MAQHWLVPLGSRKGAETHEIHPFVISCALSTHVQAQALRQLAAVLADRAAGIKPPGRHEKTGTKLCLSGAAVCVSLHSKPMQLWMPYTVLWLASCAAVSLFRAASQSQRIVSVQAPTKKNHIWPRTTSLPKQSHHETRRLTTATAWRSGDLSLLSSSSR